MAKKRVVKKKVDISKRNFEIFAHGVERLKELEKELNDLNTKGHYKDEQFIRSRLRTVSEIPDIERAMKKLKLKIRNKYKPRKKTSRVSKDIGKIRGELPKLKGKLSSLVGMRNEFPIIEQELHELSSKFDSIKNKSKIKIDSGVGIVVNHDFNDFLNNVKVSLSERVKEKEEELHESAKIELTRREKMYSQKHKKLLNDYKNKNKELVERLSKKEKDLVTRLKNKEKTIATRLKNKEKALKIRAEINYEAKVNADLNKEVAAKLEEKVKKKFEEKKNSFTKKYKEALKKHSVAVIEDHKNKLTNSLKRGLAVKIRMFHRAEEAEKKKYHDKVQDLNKQRKKLSEDRKKIKYTYEKRMDKEVGDLVKEETRYKKGLKLRLVKAKKKLNETDAQFKRRVKVQLKKDRQNVVDRLEKKLNLDYTNLTKKEKALKQEEKELREKKERYELRKKSEIRKTKSRLTKAFNFKYQFEVTKKDKEVHDLKDKIVQEYHKKLHTELRKREIQVRDALKKRYDLELKAKIREHENLLKKKKLALESQIQKKLKRLLD